MKHGKSLCERIRSKYPERVPVIVKKVKNSKVNTLTKSKYLIPLEFNMGQLIYIIRNFLKLPPEKAIFVFVNNTLPSNNTSIATLYEEYKNEEGFLIIEYTDENTFGQN